MGLVISKEIIRTNDKKSFLIKTNRENHNKIISAIYGEDKYKYLLDNIYK